MFLLLLIVITSFRLFPAPSESLDNPYKLSAFIPLVERCGESPVMAIRKLAAKALVALIDSNKIGKISEIERKQRDNWKTNLWFFFNSTFGEVGEGERGVDYLLNVC